MPSYTETFACPVCCGTTTTTVGPSTTTPPGVCPEGYEPCEGQSTFIVDSDCIYNPWPDSDGQCPEGCTPFSPNWPTDLVEDCETYSPGTFVNSLCCRPTTSTTENPLTSTTCAPGQTIGFRLQDIFNEFSSTCKICVAVQCGSSEPNIFYTCEECESQANVFNSAQPFCNLYECSPSPPL